MIDSNEYTGSHTHPRDSHVVEIVAYERIDSGWDVFVFEPPGSCPELEADRVDEYHIFFAKIDSIGDLDKVAVEIDAQLGEDYQPTVFFRESGGRRDIGRIQRHLQKNGAQRVWVRSNLSGDWELVIRRKDFALAEEITASNV